MATTNKNFKVKNGLDVGGNAAITGDANVTGKLSITAQSGDEGGEIFLSNAATNTTITNGVTIDVYKDRLRFFEQGGDARGFYVDITTGASGASTNLVGGGGGTASNSFATVSANGTSVVADSSTDTLTITPGDNVQIVGNATSDTITFTVNGALSNITSIVTPNYITFDTTPTGVSTDAGTMYWDSGDGIPKVILNANVSIGMGQESILLVKNATGSTLPKGSVVYINGAQGQNPTVALADADTEATSSKTFGFVAEQILDTAEGYVITEGVFRGANTLGFTEGGAIWLSSTAGAYTQTIPAEPAHSVFLGYAVKAHETAGEIIVKIQNGYELTELHGVIIEETLADNEVLAYDSTSGLWKNQTAEEAGVANLSGATFTGNVAGTNANLSGNVTINGTTNLGLAETQKVVNVRTPVDTYTLANNTYTINLASGNYFSNITTQRLYNSSSGWTIVGTNTYSTNATGTSPLTYNLISSGSTAQGDVAIVMVTTDSNTNALPTVNLTASPGWTTNSAAATTYGSAVFYKTLGATPDTTIVLNYGATDVTAVASIVIRSSDILPAYVSAIATPVRANSTSGVPVPPATTTTIANTLVVTAGSLRNDIVDATASATGPTGYSNYTLATSGNVAGTAAASMLATKFVANVGTETPTAFAPKFANTVAVSDQWSAWTFQVAAYLDPTITLTNAANATYPASTYVLHINNSPSTTTTWSGLTFSWQSNTAPTLSSAAGLGNNIVILETIDGSTFRGAVLNSYA